MLLGDRSFGETVVNVLTSIPFVAIGLQTPRHDLQRDSMLSIALLTFISLTAQFLMMQEEPEL